MHFCLTGVPSETVKSFTQALGLPTISASYGQEGDLRQWRDIDANKQKYLLQIMPPADIIPEVVRSIVRKMNITNAAILYDETFIMDHKYKSLLQNIQTRHVIARIAQGDRERTEEIEKLRNLDINNFFLLGSLRTIGPVLGTYKTIQPLDIFGSICRLMGRFFTLSIQAASLLLKILPKILFSLSLS